MRLPPRLRPIPLTKKSLMYYVLGSAYNAKEMRDQAIAAFQKVTDGGLPRTRRLLLPN